MTVSPSGPGNVSPSRRALIERLIALRVETGLSGNAFAKRMGIPQPRLSKIENYVLMPKESDLIAWAQASGHADDIEELKTMLAEARRDRLFAEEFNKKGGAADFERSVGETERDHTRIGEFGVAVIPGFLQTENYARALLTVPTGPGAWGSDQSDIEEKINERLRRQEILYNSAKQVQVVLTESALRTLFGEPEIQVGQLDKLMALLQLPSIDIRIIDFRQKLPTFPYGFRIYDTDLVVSESLAGEKTYTTRDNPREIAAFTEAFNELRQVASAGDDAAVIIQRTIDDLRTGR